ncbi:hypothetical protein DMC47_25610 [Nostoc sp. 3335mG]|nr:hypothetical protein DMC47_25610 [Nostoc sp. 3335mG]
MWFAFFALVYALGLLAGRVLNGMEALVGLVSVSGPLTLGVLYRRIRVEAAKSPDALYRKMLQTNR